MDYVESTISRLSGKKAQAILLHVNLHTHMTLKAYGKSTHQSMNTVISTLLQEFCKTIEPTLKVAYQIPEPIPTQTMTREEAQERFRRYVAYRDSPVSDKPEHFGLHLKKGSDPKVCDSYEICEVESGSEPIPDITILPTISLAPLEPQPVVSEEALDPI